MIVLDASALLAFLFGEPGGEVVGEVVDESCLSAVNLTEVLSRFSRDGLDPDLVSRRIAATRIEIVPFDSDAATLAARLTPDTRSLGLSLGDRACLALALARGIPALTADGGWAALSIGVEVRLIR